jgi:FKBP-type peptidyl-prolyl cis-trans isomerase SlyD
MIVADGKRVSIEYTLRFEDEAVIESNVGQEPLEYIQGSHEIVPGVEEALAGVAVGTSQRVTVLPEKGYGLMDPEAFEEVDKQQLPEGVVYHVGAQLVARDEIGNERPLRIHEVREHTVILDLNHPLAGKTLIFDIKVLAIA